MPNNEAYVLFSGIKILSHDSSDDIVTSFVISKMGESLEDTS